MPKGGAPYVAYGTRAVLSAVSRAVLRAVSRAVSRAVLGLCVAQRTVRCIARLTTHWARAGVCRCVLLDSNMPVGIFVVSCGGRAEPPPYNPAL